MISCTRRLEFDAGHRLLNHEGKCAMPHGHRYAVEITCMAEELDSVGRVIDFAVIKERVGHWIDNQIDHGFIVNRHDHDLVQALATVSPTRIYYMSENPTAENIAKLIFVKAMELLEGTGVLPARVRVYETPNCYADWTQPPTISVRT